MERPKPKSMPEYFDDFEPPSEEIMAANPDSANTDSAIEEIEPNISGLASERLNEIDRDLWNLIYGDDEDEDEDEDDLVAYTPLSRVRN